MFFDILIDDTKIDKDKDENNYLKSKINEYGTIIAKIEDPSATIDAKTVEIFIQSILRYIKTTNKFVGLALLVGSEVTNEAQNAIENYSNKSIGYLMAIEKPVIMNSIH